MRRLFATALTIGLSLVATATAPEAVWAQTYPDRPVRLIVGFPPGTGPDILARVVGDKLSQSIKQSVVIENRPGAGGQIATQAVAKGAADGYSLLLAEAGSISIAPAAFAKLGYDPVKELVAVAELAYADFVLVVGKKSPHQTLADFIAANKGNANGVNFGTFGAGSPGHFGAVEFGLQTGVTVVPVHFRSAGDAISAIIAGDVGGAWVSVAIASSQIAGGEMRGLAITAKSRSSLIPAVPTSAEAGAPKLNFSSWLGVLAPAETPASILDQLSRSMVEAVQSPEVKTKLTEVGFAVTGTGRVDMQTMLKGDAKRWGDIVKASGFKGN